MKEEPTISVAISRDELDRSLGGGIPTNSTILFQGANGTGKSIVSQRLLYGLLKSNKKVTYISSELNTQGFIEQMASLDYDIKYNILDETLLFIPVFPYYGTTELGSDMLKRLMSSKKIFSTDIIIIDTLSNIFTEGVSATEKLLFIRFIKKLNSLGKVVIVNMDDGQTDGKMAAYISDIADVIIEFKLKEFAGSIIRVMNIIRYKRSKSEVLSAIPFRVEPGKGLTIEIASFD